MNVTKRNGDIQPLDISKIKEQIAKAYDGIPLNPIELESKLTSSFKNNVKTSDIQDRLVNIATQMIDLDSPEMTLVAGRLSMYQLHRQIYKNTKFEYTNFSKYVHYAVNNGYYRKDILQKYTEEDLLVIETFINPKYDFDMNIAQVLSLKSKYLLRNKKGHIEYPQFADLASAMILAQGDMARVKRYFLKLVKMEISLATPFKANLRREAGNTGSCFILPTNDSGIGIYKTWQDMSIISSKGGGIGVYLGDLRPEGADLDGLPVSNNITRWTKIINDIAIAINQRGIRKGAITPALDWWHMDIESFIEMKSETGGDLRDKSFDLFPQVVVDRYFVDAVLNDREVLLFDQHELKQKTGIVITGLIDDDLYKVQEDINSGVYNLKHTHKIKAKELWKSFLRIWVETGDFYITHKDNLNLCNYLKGENLIANSANLCTESFSITKNPKNFKLDVRDDKIYHAESDGLYHSCSLNSINLGVVTNETQLKEICYDAVDTLDASIDTGTMPVIEAENSSQSLRNIGIGVLGVADWMANNKLSYEKKDDLDELEKVYERIAWYCYERSIELAEEKGSYPLFEKANYDKMFGKTGKELNEQSLNRLDWVQMIKNIKQKGIRNFLLLATAPNTSSGILMASTASWQPPHSKMNYQTLSDISVPILPRYIKNRHWYYKGKFQYAAHTMVDVVRRMQKWIDTGISMEVNINPDLTTIKQISDAFLNGFKNKELKAVYYSLTIDGKKGDGCTDCAN